MGFVWLEMLSWSDRNNGRLKGDASTIARTLSGVSLKMYPRRSKDAIEMAFRYMEDCGWIAVRSDCIEIVNYAEYHNTRDANKIPLGNKQPPLLPNLPKQPIHT